MFFMILSFHPAPPGRGSLLVLEYRQPALKRRPIFKAPLRGALEFGQSPSRFQQSDGRGRPSHNVARASRPRLAPLPRGAQEANHLKTIGTIRIATIFATLIIGFIAGPAVSL